jgi:Zn-dependent protease with chaperone function
MQDGDRAVERERLLLLLIILLCTPAVMLGCAALPVGELGAPSARDAERRCWRNLWLPLLPGLMMGAFLVGWALVEPDPSDEHIPLGYWFLIAPLSLLWLRAFDRAVSSLKPPRALPVAATIGIVRPRVVIAPELQRLFDRDELAAALAHEQAHVRGRDPLRLWLAQLVTDLQWPSARARQRLDTWRGWLELACDEEARLDGIDGADLAAALVISARQTSAPLRAVASMHRADENLARRIARLLHEPPVAAAPSRTWRMLAGVLGAATCGIALGVYHGDWALRLILGG